MPYISLPSQIKKSYYHTGHCNISNYAGYLVRDAFPVKFHRCKEQTLELVNLYRFVFVLYFIPLPIQFYIG